MHLTTLAAATIANSGGVTGTQQPSAPVAFAWGSNKFTASRRAPALPCAISRNPWMSRVKTTDTRNTRHSSSSSSRSSRRKMSPHGDKYFIRECGDDGEEYREIIGSVDSWWGGRRMTPMLPRLFFDHFFKTSFVAVMKQEDEQVDGPPPTLASTTLTTRSKNPTRTTAGQTTTTKTPTTTAVVGFVCGFVSPSRPGRVSATPPMLLDRNSKAISYTVGFVSRKRPFSTEAQIELSYTVEKGLFRLNFFRLKIPTGGSSRKT